MNYEKCRILLVDDDPDDAALTIYSLRKIPNLQISHIDDGSEALDYVFDAGQTDPSLILLDLRMPLVDGIHILRELKHDPVKRHIPVAVLISSNEGKRYVESFNLKPDGYIFKPVECKSLLAMMVQLGWSRNNFYISQLQS